MGVRVGVIGAGIMGADHANTLQRFVSGAQLALVADVDQERARRVARPLGCGASRDPLALISEPEVEAVIIASLHSVGRGVTGGPGRTC